MRTHLTLSEEFSYDASLYTNGLGTMAILGIKPPCRVGICIIRISAIYLSMTSADPCGLELEFLEDNRPLLYLSMLD